MSQSYIAIALTLFKAFSQFTNTSQCMSYDNFCKSCRDYVDKAGLDTPLPKFEKRKTSFMHGGKVLALNSCALLGKATSEIPSTQSVLEP